MLTDLFRDFASKKISALAYNAVSHNFYKTQYTYTDGTIPEYIYTFFTIA